MNSLTKTFLYLAPVAIVAGLLLFTSNEPGTSNCAALAEQLDARHKQVLQRHPRGSEARTEGLYAIEDSAFKMMEQCPQHAAVFAAMGDLQISLGQVPLAQLYGEKAVSIDSSNWHAHYVLGSALNLQKQYESGLQHLQRASQLQPGNSSLLLNLCSSYVQNGKHEQAISTCSAVIDKGPDPIRGTAYLLRAQARQANNEPALAEKDLQQAKELGYE